MKLTVGIDGYNLAMPSGTGVATYGYVLANTLQKMNCHLTGLFGLTVGSRPELREILFFDRLQRPKKAGRRPNEQTWQNALRPLVGLRVREVPLTGLVEKSSFTNRFPSFDRLVSADRLFEIAHEHFRRFGRFISLEMKDPPAIMHWTYPVPIRLKGSRNIYSLHDIVPLKLPYTTLDVKRTYFKLIEQCVQRADHLCTVSEASRFDIVSRFPGAEEKLSVTYQASPMPASIDLIKEEVDAEMIEGIFGLKHRDYFMYFGAIEPKKNIGRLIEAYLTTRCRTPLVIVGARAWESEQELVLLGGGGEGSDTTYGQRLADRVIRLDYLPRALLLKLVRGAKAVTFPSLYEGFGLPVHEAMLLGTPVLTSRTSSLPEVAGDAAVSVDPYDVEAIAAGLRRLDEDPGFCQELSDLGRRQAANFSVERYRTRLSDMYEAVLAKAALHR